MSSERNRSFPLFIGFLHGKDLTIMGGSVNPPCDAEQSDLEQSSDTLLPWSPSCHPVPLAFFLLMVKFANGE